MLGLAFSQKYQGSRKRVSKGHLDCERVIALILQSGCCSTIHIEKLLSNCNYIFDNNPCLTLLDVLHCISSCCCCASALETFKAKLGMIKGGNEQYYTKARMNECQATISLLRSFSLIVECATWGQSFYWTTVHLQQPGLFREIETRLL